MLFSSTQLYSYEADKLKKRKMLKIIIPIIIILILIIVILIILTPIKSFKALSTKMPNQSAIEFPISKEESIFIKNIAIESSDQKIIQLQTSQIGPLTQTQNKNGPQEKQSSRKDMKISYFHKNNQIAIVYDVNTKSIKFSAPADTGFKFILPNGLTNEDMSALSQIILYLPLYLIEQFETVIGKKMKFTTQLSYDGVYNRTSKKYKIVSQEYLRFSEKVIGQNQKDLADYDPVIKNMSDVKEVARELAKCYSRIVENFLNIVSKHHQTIKQLQKNLQIQTISVLQQDKLQIFDQMLSCISLQPQILRCQAQVWRSSQMQTDNMDLCRPLEIWSYVLYSV